MRAPSSSGLRLLPVLDPSRLLSPDLFLDIAKLVLAKEHFHAHEECWATERATIDRVLGQFPQAVLYILMVCPRHQPVGVKPRGNQRFTDYFRIVHLFGSSHI